MCIRDRPLDSDGDILDIVGTGGDKSGSFNISTTAGIIAAAAGVRIAKHGLSLIHI